MTGTEVLQPGCGPQQRYRLRRIAKSTGIDLADPEARFVLELELRMLGLMGSGS
jgi:hypothetical protein